MTAPPPSVRRLPQFLLADRHHVCRPSSWWFFITQGIILRRQPRALPFDVFRGPVLAAGGGEVAADVSDMLSRGRYDELSDRTSRGPAIFATNQQTKGKPKKVGWLVFVATRDKMFSIDEGPVARG